MNKTIRYWAPVYFVLSLIFYLSSLPGDEIPKNFFPFQDKVHHLLAYMVVGFVLGRALTNRIRIAPQFELYKKPLLIGLMIGMAYGAFDEFHQSFTPNRSTELADFIADSIGVAIGLSFVIPYRRWVLNRSQ